MNIRSMSAAVAAAIGLAVAVVATPASACGTANLKPLSSSAKAAGARFAASIATAQQTITHAAVAPTAADLIVVPHGSIVGLWRFASTAPDGSPLDWGFQEWHDDGTELTNSGAQLPEDGSFCMGAWQQQGHGAYFLNHWAISYGGPPDFDPTEFSGLVNIREIVSVDASGDSMSGTVSLDLYAQDGTTFLAHLADGTVTGARITP